MATAVVGGVGCAHIGLSLLRLLGIGNGREEESKSRDMNVIVAFDFVFETNRRTPPLFDDELIALVFLVSFPEGVAASSTQNFSHVNGRSSFCGLKLGCLLCTHIVFREALKPKGMPKILIARTSSASNKHLSATSKSSC